MVSEMTPHGASSRTILPCGRRETFTNEAKPSSLSGYSITHRYAHTPTSVGDWKQHGLSKVPHQYHNPPAPTPAGFQLSRLEQLRSFPEIRGIRPNLSACAADKTLPRRYAPHPLPQYTQAFRLLLQGRSAGIHCSVEGVGGTLCCFSNTLQ
ncbi:hypothetical protein MHYP_G00271890 [Metynnis hypsauchen]